MNRQAIEARVIDTAHTFIATEGITVRSCALVIGVSKSTVHKDLSERLKKIDSVLYDATLKVLLRNKAERHIRGGEATKHKWSDERLE